MKGFIPFILLVWCLSAHAAASIKVTKALWGTKEVTRQAAAECDDKDECDYQVSAKFIGKAGGAQKSFSITWLCGTDPGPHTLTKAHDATGRILRLTCESPAAEPRPSSPYDLTLRKMIASRFSGLTQYLNSSCEAGLREIAASGKKLESRLIAKGMSKLSLMTPSVAVFYHYTKARPVRAIGRSDDKARIRELFDFVRDPSRDLVPTQRLFYVAGDPTSSKSFGPIQLRVWIAPNAVVLDIVDIYNEYGSFQNAVGLELATVYSELASCATDVISWDALFYLAAEDMGVGLVRYQKAGSSHWYQVMTPDVVDRVLAN